MADGWSLRDARSNLTDVVNAALEGFPQWIKSRGKKPVVVLSEEDYLRLSAKEGGIVSFFRDSPLGKAVRAGEVTLERERGQIREVDF